MAKRVSTPLLLALPLLLGGPAGEAEAQEIGARLLAEGLVRPVAVAQPPGDDRIFICEQHTGRIRILKNGQLLATPFLDIGSEISTGGEQGLLGLVFHPGFAVNRRLFVYFTDTAGASVLRRYLASVSNPDVANPGSARLVFGPLTQPSAVHNGGTLAFGPDGKLYLGLGDGGSWRDSLQNGQNLAVGFGKMLRFDVDLPFPHVPIDNPFLANPAALDLIWAYGLRNPWQFSFDRETGGLWITDVGSDQYEEVNFQPANSRGGENYGWNCLEGPNCTGWPQSACACTQRGIVPPVHSYSQPTGCAITGAVLYRGSAMPALHGRLLVTDLCTAGRIWSLAWNGSTLSGLVDHGSPLGYPSHAVALTQDRNGEVMVLDRLCGRLGVLEEPCANIAINYCLTAPNSAGPGATIAVAGTQSIAANQFEVVASGAPPGQQGIFMYAFNQIEFPFGEGFRCVGAGGIGLFRLHPAQMVGPGGEARRRVDFTLPPASEPPGQIHPGDVWNFQFWYRDPGFGPAGFNLSDAVEVHFCP